MPRLLVVDSETGDLLNNSLKMCLIEYVHEFFNNQTSSKTIENSIKWKLPSHQKTVVQQPAQTVSTQATHRQPPPPPPQLPQRPPQPQLAPKAHCESVLIGDELDHEHKTIVWRNFNLNFDLDAYDLFDNQPSSRYRHQRRHRHRRHHNENRHRSAVSASSNDPTHRSTSSGDRLVKCRKRKLNRCLIEELNENLIEIGNAVHKTTNTDISSSALPRNFYLIYFCSFFTSSNGRQKALFEQIVEFLSFVQEKIECTIRIVLVSSDFLESDYERLVEKYRNISNNSDQVSSFTHSITTTLTNLRSFIFK